MPSINSRKYYQPQSYYHVYNRGVNKKAIVFNPTDCLVFRHFAQDLLQLQRHDLNMIVYALMPNHYHFLLYQESTDAIRKFITSLQIRYAMYINKKYQRVGTLYQGVYRAHLVRPTRIEEKAQYILTNPARAGLIKWYHSGYSL